MSHVEDLRRSMGHRVRSLLTDGTPDLEPFTGPPGDPGLMGPDSVAWRVHADVATLVGGLQALLLQTLHPLAMAGVAEFSDYQDDPWGRLHRTARFLALTTFANTSAARSAIDEVRAVHDRVHGTAPDGRPYDANDPQLLRWVHCTEVDAFVRAVRVYGTTPLTDADVDTYLAEMAVVAEGLGATDVPTSRSRLDAYWAAVRPELAATEQALDAARFILRPPTPLWARPAYAVITAAAIGLLPDFARRELRLPASATLDAVAVRPAARGVIRVLGWSLGRSPVAGAARQRCAA